jgi:hypothetical protein
LWLDRKIRVAHIRLNIKVSFFVSSFASVWTVAGTVELLGLRLLPLVPELWLDRQIRVAPIRRILTVLSFALLFGVVLTEAAVLWNRYG